MFYARTLLIIATLVLVLQASTPLNAQNTSNQVTGDKTSAIPPFMTVLEEDMPKVTFYVAKAKDPTHATFDEVVGEFLEARDAMMNNPTYNKIDLNRPLVVFYLLDKNGNLTDQVFAAGMDFIGLTSTPSKLQKFTMPMHTARIVFFKGPYTGTQGSKQDKSWSLVTRTEKNKPIPGVWFGYEVYLISYDKTENEDEFVTKVCWPIELLKEKKTDIQIPKKSATK